MAFIGNTNTTQAFTPAIDYFSGTGSATAFTLSRPVASVAQVQVTIDNVAQNPSSAYTVSSNTITFTSAPLSGTNNIYVYYTSPITQVIAPGQGTVTATSMASSTGTGAGVFQTSPTITTPVISSLSSASATALTLQSAGTTAITVSTSQNVGIGTTSPTQKLTVSGAIQATSNSSDFDQSGAQFDYASGAGRIASYISTGSNLQFLTNPNGGASAERMRIDSSGVVNIGCTSGIGYVTRLNLSVNSGTNKWCVGPYTGNATAFIISENTSFGVYLPNTSATAWSSASDERLKENLVPIENGLTKVCSLRSVIGNFIADEEKTKRPFLIAQDVQAVLPEAVTVTPSGEHLGIAYTEVIPLLVASIKELKAINDTQAETINALTARIVALENR